MGDARGFLNHGRKGFEWRDRDERLGDWKEVYKPFPIVELQTQASRCMDCGIPFCNNGCPLGNIIPDWNDLVYRDHWHAAIDRLHATNNFPEFTGRLCPAPCEQACVLGINQDPVTIKHVEVTIIDRAFEEGWVTPVRAKEQTGKSVAVIGSGPAGLAAAQQLTRAGHRVVVFERADRIGGLLRYGIPEFKMEKRHVDRRIEQMQAEGTEFRVNTSVGPLESDDVTADQLREEFDAVVICTGSTVPRDLHAPGRELDGIHFAMDYLPWANKAQHGDLGVDEVPISAKGKKVVIIGGGDTGADCLGTANRQGCESVHQFEILPRPPEERPSSQPWPTYAMTYKVTSAHDEGVERVYSVNTEKFVGRDGKVTGLVGHHVEMVDGRFQKVEGTDFELEVDLVLLAMGFLGPEQPLAEQFGVELTDRGNIARTDDYATNVEGVFVAGDAGRGQSLIVWAIAEGRAAAAAVDRHLMGSSALPVPIPASAQQLRA